MTKYLNRIFVHSLCLMLASGAFFPAEAESLAPSCPGCNVIIIGVDTLRADHIHYLGYARETTPTIDALAAKGFVFDQAISTASWTVPSFMSIFTGTEPSVHRVTNKFTEFTETQKTFSNLNELSPGIKTLAEAMKQAGYATGGFTGDAGVSAKFGYAKGFDVYTDELTFGGFDNSQKHALKWLDSVRKKKFFMFFHGYDLHGQFAIPPDYRSFYSSPDYQGLYKGTAEEEAELREDQLEGPLAFSPSDVQFWNDWYDGKVRDADLRLKNFLHQLKRRKVLENTVIVVLSDHGEEFYEHKGIDHGHSLYDEQIHVPLIFVVPGSEGGTVIHSQVAMIDLIPTLFEILGIQPDAEMVQQLKGRRSLVPNMTAPQTDGYDVFSETDYRNFTHKRSLRAADGWKYILTLDNGKEELYDLSIDPGETSNVILNHLDKAELMRVQLRAHLVEDLKTDLSAPVAKNCLPVYDGECVEK